MRVRLIAVTFSFAALGCAHSERDRDWVLRNLSDPSKVQVGQEVSLLDGLDEREAVAVALAHSASYRADLARLEVAQADLEEAHRPVNPQLTVMGALGPISAFATLLAPLESLWQAPRRSATAAHVLDSVAESLVQDGLDLAREVRVAHALRGLAEDRLRIRTVLADVHTQLERLADDRAQSGEASVAESAALRAEAALARDAREVALSDLLVARAQLRTLLGVDAHFPRCEVVFRRTPRAPQPLPELVKVARQARPDARAAELSVEAAFARAGWERTRVVAVAAQFEGHWTRPDTLAARPGARIELPLFNANVGGIGRAKAEVRRSEEALVALRQRIVLEVVQARANIIQAQSSLRTYRAAVLPALEEARQAAYTNYEAGEESFVVVLDVLRRTAEAQLREAELMSQTRRADADLERAIGARIGDAS